MQRQVEAIRVADDDSAVLILLSGGRVEAEIGRIEPLAAPFVANWQPEMIEVHDCSVAYGHGGLQVIGFFRHQPAGQLASKRLTLMPRTGSSAAASSRDQWPISRGSSKPSMRSTNRNVSNFAPAGMSGRDSRLCSRSRAATVLRSSSKASRIVVAASAGIGWDGWLAHWATLRRYRPADSAASASAAWVSVTGWRYGRDS